MTKLLTVAEIAAIKKTTRQVVEARIKKARLPRFYKKIDWRRHDGSFIKKSVNAYRDTDLSRVFA